MHGSHLLEELVIVLGTAAATTIVFHALRIPVVLGYLLAGLVIGPFLPVPLVADVKLVQTLSELGVILLMFSIGTELNLGKLAKIGLPAALTAAIEVWLMFTLGFLAGRILGWTTVECIFLGACVGISSTMLVAKAFAEAKLTGQPFAQLVFAILVFEDLIAIVLLAALGAIASGAKLSAGAFGVLAGKLSLFLGAMIVGGLFVVPRLVRLVFRNGRKETILITSLGICFAMSYLADLAGFSVALGAFIGGVLVGESGRGEDVEHGIAPFRDAFGAIFFVAVGMTIDPAEVWRHKGAVLLVTAIVITGKAIGVTTGAFLTGAGLRRSVRAGLSLTQIGELSFVMAALGAASGATGKFLLPVAVAASALTSITTPLAIKFSDAIAVYVDHRLPRRLATFVTFYGSWIDRLGTAPQRETRWSRLRRPLGFLLVDAILLAVVAVAAGSQLDRAAGLLGARADVAPHLARWLVIGAASALAAVLALGLIRNATRLAHLLALEVVPGAEPGKLDLGNAPRRALVRTLELAILLAIGLPLIAVIQPFAAAGGAVLLVVVIGSAALGWRSVTNLQGHVRAGSQLIVEALARQTLRSPTEPATATTPQEPEPPPQLDDVRALLPGIPGVVPHVLDPTSAAVGQTLAALNLRALTGASVVAITRAAGGTVMPGADETLVAGDLLALVGSDDAIAAARQLLTTPPDSSPAP